MVNEARLREGLISIGLGRVADALLSLARPSAALRTAAWAGSGMPLGQSRIGGCPDLPATFAWPYWGGKPQAFVAQVNLAEVAPHLAEHGLPATGLLYFFCDAAERPWGLDPTDRESWTVLYDDSEPSVRERTSLPFDAAGEGQLPFDAWFKPCSVTFSYDLAPPSWFSPHLDAIMSWEEQDRYWRWWIGYFKSRRPVHRLLGLPDVIQGDGERERQLATHGAYADDAAPAWRNERYTHLKADADDWLLLLQVDSDDAALMWWGDGMIQYWIRERDLRARNFASTWLVWQPS